MKLAALLSVVSMIILSCDDESIDGNRRISLITISGQAEYSYQDINFTYQGAVLTSSTSLHFSRQFLTDPFVLQSEDLDQYKYVNDKLVEIVNSEYPFYKISFTYNSNGTVKVDWAGGGRSNGYDTYTYSPSGKLDSIFSDWTFLSEGNKSKSKVNWNGDNVESLVTRSECMCGGVTTPIISFDTVTYVYGGQVNPLSDSKYVGYTESLVGFEKIPHASKNVLLEQNSASVSYVYGSDNVLLQQFSAKKSHQLSYVFDGENYPIEIMETITENSSPPTVIKKVIKYQ